jgi:hypothetical protein
MDDDFYKWHAQRLRDLAHKADPFTRKRLLDLADKYDAKTGKPSRANIGNFDYLTNTWVRIETLLSPDFVEMDNNGSDSDNRRRDRPPTAVAASPAKYVKPVAFTAAAIEQPTPVPQPPAVLDTPLRSDNKRKVEAELTAPPSRRTSSKRAATTR